MKGPVWHRRVTPVGTFSLESVERLSSLKTIRWAGVYRTVVLQKSIKYLSFVLGLTFYLT